MKRSTIDMVVSATEDNLDRVESIEPSSATLVLETLSVVLSVYADWCEPYDDRAPYEAIRSIRADLADLI